MGIEPDEIRAVQETGQAAATKKAGSGPAQVVEFPG